jgi:hypothetical protein
MNKLKEKEGQLERIKSDDSNLIKGKDEKIKKYEQ